MLFEMSDVKKMLKKMVEGNKVMIYKTFIFQFIIITYTTNEIDNLLIYPILSPIKNDIW